MKKKKKIKRPKLRLSWGSLNPVQRVHDKKKKKYNRKRYKLNSEAEDEKKAL